MSYDMTPEEIAEMQNREKQATLDKEFSVPTVPPLEIRVKMRKMNDLVSGHNKLLLTFGLTKNEVRKAALLRRIGDKRIEIMALREQIPDIYFTKAA